MILYLENRIWQRDRRDIRLTQPDKLFSQNVSQNVFYFTSDFENFHSTSVNAMYGYA